MAFLGAIGALASTIGGAMVSALPTIATLASTGLSLASGLGAFGKSGGGGGGAAYLGAEKNVDTAKEQADAEEKKRRAYLASLAGGRAATVLTGGKGLIGGQVVEQGLKAQLGA